MDANLTVCILVLAVTHADVHVTTDGVILMFHDPTLDRTTNGKGAIKEQAWAGAIENVRTTKPPIQPIPRLEELVALIMEPENRHVVLNVCSLLY